MGQANEKDLDFKIKKNGVPHSESATENEILRNESPALDVKFYQSKAKPAVLQEI
jgi:hypothetical protein